MVRVLAGAHGNRAPAEVWNVNGYDHLVAVWQVVGKTEERVVRDLDSEKKFKIQCGTAAGILVFVLVLLIC